MSKKNSLTKKCLECGLDFVVRNYRKESAKFCSIKCKNKNQDKGKTEFNYRIRRSLEFKIWRELVFERDDWTCQKCFIRGFTLHPHHIENFSDNEDKRFNIDNGITLCRKCHYDFHLEYGFKNNNKIQIGKFNAIAVGVQA